MMTLDEVKAFAELTRRQADSLFNQALNNGCPAHSLFTPKAAAVMTAVASAPSTEEFARLINIASPDSRTILQTILLMGFTEMRARHHELMVKTMETTGGLKAQVLSPNIDPVGAVSSCKFGMPLDTPLDTSTLDAMAKRAEDEAARRRAAKLN